MRTPNPNIFCNIPWFELNINQDGSFDLCGCQNDKITMTPLGEEWNIKRMSIDDYWNSTRMQEKRRIKLGDTVDPMCKMCQMKDAAGYTSTRQKENLKSVIFQNNFSRSFQQSPHKKLFTEVTDSNPVSLHLNIGNACNLACKMCNPEASSRIQAFQKHAGWISKDYDLNHWLHDETGKQHLLDWVARNKDFIQIVHLIGGEPWMIPEFKMILELLQGAGQINLSFTTNGTSSYTDYYDLLKCFKKVEIGISIETADSSNDYIRHGSDINTIITNIEQMKSNMSEFDYCLRTVPQWTSVTRYHTVLEQALKLRMPIDASYPARPAWLFASILPNNVKQIATQRLSDFMLKLPVVTGVLNNTKNVNNLEIQLREEATSLINHINSEVNDPERLRKQAAQFVKQQDAFFKQNIKDYLPEHYEWISSYGYAD